MYRIIAITLTAIFGISGCATPYGSSGITGGHTDSRLNYRLIKVDFHGNGFITSDKIQTYALYRCAELAREAKKPYFVLYNSLTAAAKDTPSSLPRVGSMGNKPSAFAFISLEDEPRPGAQNVSTVLTELGPLVQSTPEAGKAE